jgi:hypothetical protein
VGYSRSSHIFTVGRLLVCFLFFFVGVAKDDDLAVAGWPQEIAVELTEETLGKLKVISGIMDGIFLTLR